uniref:Uncharacterized protein n=1 Tax=Panagrolaimus sp. PS1159 TaxID=55785 RepID=A0AC35GLH0_9BILA
MTYTLLAQAIVPTIVCIIPIGISLTMAVTKANISGIGQIVSLLYSRIPVANPLTTITVIRHYRNACLNFIKAYLCTKKIASVSYIPTEMSLNQIHRLNCSNNNNNGNRRIQMAQIQHSRNYKE